FPTRRSSDLLAIELLLLISVLLQSIRMAAQRIEKIRRDFLTIGVTPSRFSEPGSRIKRLKSAGMIHEKGGIRELRQDVAGQSEYQLYLGSLRTANCNQL